MSNDSLDRDFDLDLDETSDTDLDPAANSGDAPVEQASTPVTNGQQIGEGQPKPGNPKPAGQQIGE